MGNFIPCNCNFEVVECMKMFELDKTIRFCLCPRRDRDKLEDEVQHLRRMKDDVDNTISSQRQIQPGTECKPEVRSWLDDVQEFDTEVTELLTSLQERSCSFPCNYKLGKKVSMMLERVKRLTTEREKFGDSLVNSFRRRDIDNLRREMKELREMKDDVNEVVNYQQRTQPRTECKLEVGRWMQRVEELNKEVTELLNSVEETSSSFLSNDELGRDIDMMLERVKRLTTEREKFGDSLINPRVIEDVPYPEPKFYIDRDKILSEILRHLKDDDVKKVGIYGMGGVGKTTILKEIRKEMKKPNSRDVFESVVWITVSKVVDVTDIQKQIAKELNIPLTSDQRGIEEEEERARTLRTALMDKKLLLLMDDIWGVLDLQKIGIPMPTIDSDAIKIAFTTRKVKVCNAMASQKRVMVRPMNDEDSLKLFGKNLDSEEILQDDRFLNYAEQIVKKCDGLPLAIITIAKAMTKCRELREWQDMFERLNLSLHQEIPDMENVMKILKFSFDRLGSDKLRSCLLYCCLYPEDYNILKVDLIDQWVGEGLVDSQREGQNIINTLTSACLLESGGYSFDATVTMHDMVREMTLWLTNGSDDPNNYFKVYDTSSANNLHSYDGWDKAKRISLVNCDLKSLPDSDVPACPNLDTLLLYSNRSFREFSAVNFFEFMPSLCVLDVSCTSLKEIPRSIKFLANLQFLNLHWTNIKSLPMEVGELTTLRTLNLGFTYCLQKIPQRVITKLVNLQTLNMFGSHYSLKSVENQQMIGSDSNIYNQEEQSQLMFKDLEKMKNLKDLGIHVESESHFQTLVNNPTLSTAITKVRLLNLNCNDDDLMSAISEFSKLHHLDIRNCSNLRKIEFFGTQPFCLETLKLSCLSISKIIVGDKEATVVTSSISVRKTTNLTCLMQNLSYVYINTCSMLKDVTWMAELPSLKNLLLCDCVGMKTLVVGDDEAEEGRVTGTSTYKEDKEEHQNCYFPKLVHLHLGSLQSLESISQLTSPLLFPSLKMLDIQKCPKLQNICLGCDSAKDMTSIHGEQEWWDGLKWQDEDTKSTFLPRFQPGRFQLA